DVAAPVDRARGAFPAWAALPFEQRARRLKGVRRRLLERVDEVAATIVGDTGKLTAEALTTEVLLTCELIEFYARRGGAALAPQRVSPGLLLHKRVEKRYEPLGVIGVISPWNYPFVLAISPVLSALFAGNTVVLKPSEVTPHVGAVIGELFAGDDIVQVVQGDGAV